jgi:hypothetical protein
MSPKNRRTKLQAKPGAQQSIISYFEPSSQVKSVNEEGIQAIMEESQEPEREFKVEEQSDPETRTRSRPQKKAKSKASDKKPYVR